MREVDAVFEGSAAAKHQDRLTVSSGISDALDRKSGVLGLAPSTAWRQGQFHPFFMNKNKVIWVTFATSVLLVLVLVIHKPLPRPKARAQRMHAVNQVYTVSFVITNFAVTNSETFPARLGK